MKIKLDDPWDPWFGIDIEAIIQNMSEQIKDKEDKKLVEILYKI